MTIMFQLFSAKDLQMLTYDQLLELKDIAIMAMNDDKDQKLQYYLDEVKKYAEERQKLLEEVAGGGRKNRYSFFPLPGEA